MARLKILEKKQSCEGVDIKLQMSANDGGAQVVAISLNGVDAKDVSEVYEGVLFVTNGKPTKLALTSIPLDT